ncbi:hypothetical protein CCAX7_007810 [Capsulimonas corticalis]|uniref:Uncharacterized protein n=1 Tax=Capsulimonas corticalis TaxID=2219043 RepID=A0A402D1Q9_9BACT|nr:hypothetical protein [Capsulimonas corticalis]BDI28730.1 hypothetical protein CCAX7_007810 [Capsulimonas corticalis]
MAEETSAVPTMDPMDRPAESAAPVGAVIHPPAISTLSLGQLMVSDVSAWLRIWKPKRSPDQPPTAGEIWHFWWNYCGLRATWIYRVSHAISRKRIPVLPGIFSRMNLVLHGFDMPASVPVGPGMYVPHPVGITVMANRIGENVTLVGAITIGMRHKPIFPTIGNNVFIGVGARVLGNIRIGDGASIGANAVVLTDVPPGATAVGIPAKIKLPQSTAAKSEESGLLENA